ncbi:MAG: SDR family NAD(P)-dependent oxidoreductase [Acidobacteriota bacterium]
MKQSLFDRLADRSIFFSFDRSGFERHRKSFVKGDLDVDLTGKRCLITGANSGLGRSSAHALAALGAEVWLLCRSRERGEVALEDIRFATGNDSLKLEILDVSSLDSVRQLASRVGSRQVDVLINNAGVLPAERQLSVDGIELTWATNVLGPFLLTHELLPNLKQAPQGRILNVSSGGMYTQRLDLRDTQWQGRKFDGVVAYAQTKRAEVILTELWAEQLQVSGVTCNSMHPGWADTPSVRQSLPRFWQFTKNRLRTPREGADTLVWLAACERIATETGKFFFDRRSVPSHLMRRTRERPGDRQRLWDLCCEQAGL